MKIIKFLAPEAIYCTSSSRHSEPVVLTGEEVGMGEVGVDSLVACGVANNEQKERSAACLRRANCECSQVVHVGGQAMPKVRPNNYTTGP